MSLQCPKYAVATGSKPILNVPDFKGTFGGENGTTVELANKVETCVLKGTKFHILAQVKENVYQVETNDYPGNNLYIDQHSLELTDKEPKEREKIEPSSEVILNKLWDLKKHKKIDYVWGGNCLEGIPELLSFYPPQGEVDEETKKLWSLEGTDCSGLLYTVTDGFTPRSSSQLLHFGSSLPIEGLNLEKIIELIKPLDLVVWRGHVVIFLDQKKMIESRGGKGVVFSTTLERMTEIMETEKRRPVNEWTPDLDPKEAFVIQRWHSEMRLATKADQPV